MKANPARSALNSGRTATTVVAPHVRAGLMSVVGNDDAALNELLAALTPEQRAGGDRLTDPLPNVPRIAAAVDTRLWSGADRRLLLVAALVVVDNLSILLAAASVEIDAVLHGPGSAYLVLQDGTFSFADQRVRSVVYADSTAEERADAHTSIAHALRTHGHSLIAAWHSSLASPTRSDERHSTLLRLAERRLACGDARGASLVGEFVAKHATGELRARAAMIAGRGALWSDCLDDAEASFRQVYTSGYPDLVKQAASHLELLDTLREGPADHPDVKVRVIYHHELLAPFAATTADRTTMQRLIDMAWLIHLGEYEQGDIVQARMYLEMVRSPPAWPWKFSTGAVTPFAEAHVCLVQLAYQIQAGDLDGASETMREGAQRLPLMHATGGVGSSNLRSLAQHSARLDERLSDDLLALGPRNQIDYGTHDFSTGFRAVYVSRYRRATVAAPETTWESTLTPREIGVVELVTKGLSNRDVAERLELSVRTVEVHLGRIFRKTGVKSRSALVALILRTSGEPDA